MNTLVNSAPHSSGSIHLGPGSGSITMNSNTSTNSIGSQQNSQRNLSTPHTPGSMMSMGQAQLQQNQQGQQLQQPLTPQQQHQQQQNQQQSQTASRANDPLAQLDLSSDLNFDPAAVIDGGGEGQEGLNVSKLIYVLSSGLV